MRTINPVELEEKLEANEPVEIARAFELVQDSLARAVVE
jgi:hypothetical protein